MFFALDLPNMIVDATRDLPQEFVKDCFSHILLTGTATTVGIYCMYLPTYRTVLTLHPP